MSYVERESDARLAVMQAERDRARDRAVMLDTLVAKMERDAAGSAGDPRWREVLSLAVILGFDPRWSEVLALLESTFHDDADGGLASMTKAIEIARAAVDGSAGEVVSSVVCGRWLDDAKRGPVRCGKPAAGIVYGKLLDPEALGPRCFDCIGDQIDEHAVASVRRRDGVYAIYPLSLAGERSLREVIEDYLRAHGWSENATGWSNDRTRQYGAVYTLGAALDVQIEREESADA